PLSARIMDVLLGQRYSPLRGARPGPVPYLFTQATVLPRYLELVVLPWGQNVDHDVPIVRDLSAPVVIAFAFLGALALYGVVQLPRRPLAAFAILWFFITVSVESSIFPIDDAMMEHRMYLP